MALRDLIVGGGSCAVPGTSSAANPLGRLAESIFGSASKTQVLRILIMTDAVVVVVICIARSGSLLFFYVCIEQKPERMMVIWYISTVFVL
jgi:hypothetical protein